jgi:predicted enzyme related to lactoylglutathione lyase
VITGTHAIIYSHDADGVRAFLRDVLELPSVDAGGGWLIFALPPAEVAAHPTGGPGSCELYLMCDDIQVTVDELRDKGVEFSRPIIEERWGSVTSIALPGGGELGLYQPKHPSPVVD